MIIIHYTTAQIIATANAKLKEKDKIPTAAKLNVDLIIMYLRFFTL